jgi:hypothetical protein
MGHFQNGLYPTKKNVIDVLRNKSGYSLIKARVFHLHLMNDTYGVYIYCNVDDKALLGNDSEIQWKRSDRYYAMTQYTHVNNGGEYVSCVVGAVVISPV